jgi:hypothetical protein
MSTRTSLVTGVDFVSLPTRDVEAAMEFYGNVLDLTRSSVWQRPGAEPLGVEFETGTVTIALIAAEQLGIPFNPTRFRSRCTSTTSRSRAPSSSHGASPSSPTRSTAVSVTWPASRIRTETR